MNNKPLKVMITGATSGIGEALSKQYLLSGDDVTSCGRTPSKLQRLSSEYPLLNTLCFDITDKTQVKTAAAKIHSLDIIILNAGDCAYIDNAKTFDSNIFNKIININLLSVGLILEHFLPKLNSGGQLVFISSSATILPFSRAQAYGA